MSQIICRIDQSGKPLVFVADSYSNGQLLAWRPGTKDTEVLSIDYYRATQPMETVAAQELARKYARAMQDDNVGVRERLIRNYRHMQAAGTEVKAKLNNGGEQTSIVTVSGKGRRSAAAKKRYEAEMAKTQQAESGKPDLDELAMRIAKILKPLF